MIYAIGYELCIGLCEHLTIFFFLTYRFISFDLIIISTAYSVM